jgi:predicted amino acid dehydrogenase
LRHDTHHLQPEDTGINRFAFVVHPLDTGFIHRHPWFKWTRFLPDGLVETIGAYFPPIYLARITGGRSPASGQRIEGHLFSLGATPRQMMKRPARLTYRRLNQVARMAQARGARILGLGAFTSVVGDAGITVARQANIAVTSGNSLTVAVVLETARQALLGMGAADLTGVKAMVVGATGSIGSACARLLARSVVEVTLVSIEPGRLHDLKRTIQAETPLARVNIADRADQALADSDLIIMATSALGQRVIDLTRCKPGAVICDVARPPDVDQAEASLRPDVLVIESGEVLVPGHIDFGYDLGLLPGTTYACLAETALLAMEGRFENYSLGRNLEIERIQEIYRLFEKHGFKLGELRSFGQSVTPGDLARVRALAEHFRLHPADFDRARQEAAARLARLPARAKGVRVEAGGPRIWLLLAAALVMLGVLGWLCRRNQPRAHPPPASSPPTGGPRRGR